MRISLLRVRVKLLRLYRFFGFVVKSYLQHEGPKVAAYLTFTSLFAVVPVMTVTYAILAVLPNLKTAGTEMQDYLFQHFMPNTSEHLQTYLQSFAEQASNLTTVGVAMLFITSILMLRKIETSFNLIWHVKEARKGVAGFLLYWGILSIGPILMGLAFAITSYIASLDVLSSMGVVEGTSKYFLRLLPITLSAAAFSLAYIAIPNTRVSIKHGIVGGIAAALVFGLARQLMTTFVTFFPTYQLVYGVFSAVPLFLIWIFTSWSILLLGAELVQAMSSYRSSMRQSDSMLGNALVILKFLYDAHKEGRILSETELLTELPELDAETWEQMYQTLHRARLVTLHAQDGVLLARDLHRYTFADLYALLHSHSFELDLSAGVPWQRDALELFEDGIKHLRTTWRLPLTDLFDGVPPASGEVINYKASSTSNQSKISL